MIDPSRLQANVDEVRRRIEDAARRSGRDTSAVCVVAVTKYVQPAEIELLAGCGLTDVGENRAIEGLERFRQVRAKFRWHMIGHLQTNKAKKALEWAEVLHSLDRFGLAEEIEKQLRRYNKRLPTYVQVNVSGEATKGGFRPEETADAVAQIRKSGPGLDLQGLMTLAPEGADPRPHFRRLRELAERCGLPGLSMGMSSDFEIAVEEGATVVRVGSALYR